MCEQAGRAGGGGPRAGWGVLSLVRARRRAPITCRLTVAAAGAPAAPCRAHKEEEGHDVDEGASVLQKLFA